MRTARLAAIAVFVTLGLGGCAQPPAITAETVTGDWVETGGGVIHIDEDGTFEATALSVDPTSGRPGSSFDGSGTWSITESDAAEGKLSIGWVESSDVPELAGRVDTFQFRGSGDDMRLAILNLDTDQDVYLRKS